MFPRQRREKIVEILDANRHATVDELARFFDVSVDSIRKDLKYLADHGLCRREYGGAVRVDHSGFAPASPERAVGGQVTDGITDVTSVAYVDSPTLADTGDTTMLGDEGRRAVAARAYMEINDGDAVFLDISHTNLYLADLIAKGDKRVIVTTNMFEIPRRLAVNPKVTALATGGYLNAQLTGFIGTATISLMEPLLFSKAFIGAQSVDIRSNAVMTDIMDDGMVKEKVLANASYRFLLADRAKFRRKPGYRFASITDFTAVITDTEDPVVLSEIAEKGVPVLC